MSALERVRGLLAARRREERARPARWAVELLDARDALASDGRRRLQEHAATLRAQLERDASPLLLELACLIPGYHRGAGSLRGRGEHPLDTLERSRGGFSQPRLREASSWLETVEPVVAGLDDDEAERTLRELAAAPGLGREAEDEWLEAVRALSPEEARTLAADLARADDPDTGDLQLVACLFPGSFAHLARELVERDVLVPAEMFVAAPAEAHSALLALDPHWSVLRALAWIADEEARRGLRGHKWGHEAAEHAGWELLPDAGRRDLVHETCLALVPGRGGPVTVVAPHDERCGWCGRELILLLDLDLRDERLAFLRDGRDRVSVLACEACLYYGTMLGELDAAGTARWSDANEQPSYLDPEAAEAFPRERLALGAARGPLESRATFPDRGASQLGGHPAWVQDAEYPRCPHCAHPMPFLGQVTLTDVFGEDAEGVIYAFACAGCGVTATVYQQT